MRNSLNADLTTMRLVLILIVVVAACGTASSDTTIRESRPTTTPVTATTPQMDLPEQPTCSAYRGTGDLEGLDLPLYCFAGMDYVRAVESCQDRGAPPAECARLATLPEDDGGYGITGFSQAELDLMWRLGKHHLQRLDEWKLAYEGCEMEHSRDACIAAVEIERAYPYP